MQTKTNARVQKQRKHQLLCGHVSEGSGAPTASQCDRLTTKSLDKNKRNSIEKAKAPGLTQTGASGAFAFGVCVFWCVFWYVLVLENHMWLHLDWLDTYLVELAGQGKLPD